MSSEVYRYKADRQGFYYKPIRNTGMIMHILSIRRFKRGIMYLVSARPTSSTHRNVEVYDAVLQQPLVHGFIIQRSPETLPEADELRHGQRATSIGVHCGKAVM